MLNRLRSLDLYREVQRDFTESTTTGALVSVVSVLFMGALFLTETASFAEVRTEHTMLVDAPDDPQHDHATMQINMNITMHRVPCAVLSVDAQDALGSHVLDVGGELHKTRLAADGSDRGVPVDEGAPQDQKGEGCRVHGHMIVKRVPGNFHVSCHAHADLIHVFFATERMNVSHTVNHLSFGDEVLLDAARATNPLNGVRKSGGGGQDGHSAHGGHPVSYEYYLRVVATKFVDLAGAVVPSYQFVANSNEVIGHYRLPAIYFRYDVSPVTMVFSERKTPFAHYVVNLLAVVGGVFTVLGLVNSVLHSTLKKVWYKEQAGKLG